MALGRINWTRILTILLVILASLALVYISLQILSRFKQVILLLIVGALLAYIMTPLVNRLERAIPIRAGAIAVSYLLVAALIFGIAYLLFTPFVQQSRSLIENLHNPSAANLQAVSKVRSDADRVQRELRSQQDSIVVNGTTAVPLSNVQAVLGDIKKLGSQAGRLGTQKAVPEAGNPINRLTKGRVGPSPASQTQVPPSYLTPIAEAAARLQVTYGTATSDPSKVDSALLDRSSVEARAIAKSTTKAYDTMASTPKLLLRSQTWVDQHGLRIDLHDKFGQAARKISGQGAYLLDNAITIVSETLNVLLNSTLILIISFYLLSDGRQLIRWGVELIPGAREQVWFFIGSLDKVLGGYIRGQLLLSFIAGILGGGGAAVLGVPYPLLIGIVTFLLEGIPVIGPMVTVVPALMIALFFTPVLTTLLLGAWFVIFQQIVTNVIGPRVMGMAVGIHALEALLAVLIGFPLGGLLGAFLAVPLAGIVHILVREGYAYFVHGQSLPTAEVPGEDVETPVKKESTVTPGGAKPALPQAEQG